MRGDLARWISRGAAALLLAGVLVGTASVANAAMTPAAASFTPGTTFELPAVALNDHTPVALRWSATSLSSTEATYYVKVRFTPLTGQAGADNRGWTWNPSSKEWVQERDEWIKFPSITTSNTIPETWTWVKFGDESKSGQYLCQIALSMGVSGTTLNSSIAPTVTVYDVKTNGSAVHNGIAYATSTTRAEVTDPATTATVWAVTRTEPNAVDDDNNGVVDDEDRGPVGNAGDFRLGVPATSFMQLQLKRALWGPQPVESGPADCDIAIRAVETMPPAAVSGLTAGRAPGGAIDLSWDAGSDSGGSGLAGYHVYRAGVATVIGTYINYTAQPKLIASVTAGTTFTDTTATDGQPAHYVVRAYDAQTNEGPRSNTVTVTPDAIAPATDDDIVLPPDGYLNEATISVTATDANSGIKRIGYRLDGAATQSVTATSVALHITGSADPTHTIVYVAEDNAGNVSADVTREFLVREHATEADRVSGSDRYSGAVAIARAQYPGFAGVKHVVIVNGEDRAAADPLTASGLCGVFDAPMFMVTSTKVPSSVITALDSMPETITVHYVGGTGSIPKAIANVINARPKVAANDRTSGGDRFALAAAIATRMDAELGSAMPTTALIANGADSTKFFDALGLSPIAARKHYPILLVSRDGIPSGTNNALTNLGLTERYIAGGTGTISEAVRTSLGVPADHRLAGADRYTTAIAVANRAALEGWASPVSVGIAAVLPDAVAAGPSVGAQGGVMLFTAKTSLTSSTGSYLSSHKMEIGTCTVYGGTGSVTPDVIDSIELKLQ